MDKLSGVEHARIINYLKATQLNVGLLINFGSKSLEHKRFVYNLKFKEKICGNLRNLRINNLSKSAKSVANN
jgi:hypothetical protein